MNFRLSSQCAVLCVAVLSTWSLPAVAQQAGKISVLAAAHAADAKDAPPDAPEGDLLSSGHDSDCVEDPLTAAATPPDAPTPAATAQGQNATGQNAGSAVPQEAGEAAPPKRLFFIIPNFRNENMSARLPPQTVGDKFKSATLDTVDYSAVMLEVVLAAYSYGTNATPEFGRGGAAFGRYVWHSAADQSVENYMVEFIVPTITHEDTRYYTMGHGGFSKRALHAVEQVVVTRTDSGQPTFNAGEVVGAAASSGISLLYYPRPERTVGQFTGKYATNLIIDGGSFLLREFYPEISRMIFRQKTTATQ